MLKSSVRFSLNIVRAKPRLILTFKVKGRIIINIALFNTFFTILVIILFVRNVKLIITS